MLKAGKIFLYITFSVTSLASEDVKVTPLSNSSGLYYEQIGNVLLSNSHWQLVTSLDYHGYRLFYEYLFNLAAEVRESCLRKKIGLIICGYDLIEDKLDKIAATDEAMAKLLGIKQRPRVKRFWNSIGRSISKLGRGLVTEVKPVFADTLGPANISIIDSLLDSLRINGEESRNQLEHQRTLFVINSERKSIEQAIKWGQNKEKLNLIEQDIIKFNSLVQYFNETTSYYTDRGKVIIFVKDVLSFIDRFENEQTLLFKLIKNATKGELDPYILSPLDLVHLLQKIQPTLSMEKMLPLYPETKNADKLYSFVKVASTYIYNSKVIFVLHIPLVHWKMYKIHKITSLPQTVGCKKFAFIQPRSPFLIIDRNQREYKLMSLNEYTDCCKGIKEHMYLCENVRLVPTHTNQDCEVALLISAGIPSYCDTRLMILDKPVFLQLLQPNAWIYAAPHTEFLPVDCNKHASIARLTGAGFIELTGNCSIRLRNGSMSSFELKSRADFSETVVLNYSSPANLAMFVDKEYIEEIKETGAVRKQIIMPFDMGELSEISVSLKRPKINLSLLYIFLYILLMVVVLVTCVCTYLAYKKGIYCRRNKRRDSVQYVVAHFDREMLKTPLVRGQM